MTNQYLDTALASLPGYERALDVGKQAKTLLDGLAAPINVVVDPLVSGVVSAEWMTETLNAAAAAGLLERQRGILLDLAHRADATARSAIQTNIDVLLTRLHGDLVTLLDEATEVGNQLGDAGTPEEVIAADVGTAWKRLTELADQYWMLRDAQRQVMTHAPVDINVGARRTDGTGDAHCSDLYLAGLDDIWRDWRDPNPTTIRIDGQQDRLEPWPPETQQTAFLLWLVRSRSIARPWIPTPRQIDQHRAHQQAKRNPLPKVVAGIRKPPINKPTARII